MQFVDGSSSAVDEADGMVSSTGVGEVDGIISSTSISTSERASKSVSMSDLDGTDSPSGTEVLHIEMDEVLVALPCTHMYMRV
ncbi:hypothetical protein ScPMuIL_005751 [Solemya velum]